MKRAKQLDSSRKRTTEDVRPVAAAAERPALGGLYLLVFISGAILMGLEITGSRVLAPYWGNSVYVWGSLISIFLTAICAGNFLGGMLADRFPRRALPCAIAALVAIWILGIAIVGREVCQTFSERGAGDQSGPLLASVALFLAPSIGMGMISPLAIRLAAQSVASLGKTSGTLYALSTFGSIAGTLITTFALIPAIGVSAILKGLGIALLATAILTTPWAQLKRHAVATVIIALVASVWVLAEESVGGRLATGEKLVVEVSSPYQQISVVDNPRRGSRDLRFDQYIESSIELRPPHASLAGYTDYFHLAMLVDRPIERALFIGAGGGAGPRSFQMHHPRMDIDVVDIDQRVLELAQSHFFLEPGERMRLHAEDGRTFLRDANTKYDCIVLDAFTIGGRIPFHLVTREFFELCREHMTPGGVFLININSAVDGGDAKIFHALYRTLSEVFPAVAGFAEQYQRLAGNHSRNIVLMAGSELPRDWQRRAEAYESASYVGRPRMLEMAADHVTSLPDMSGAPVMTDDYAPIETMPF